MESLPDTANMYDNLKLQSSIRAMDKTHYYYSTENIAVNDS